MTEENLTDVILTKAILILSFHFNGSEKGRPQSHYAIGR